MKRLLLIMLIAVILGGLGLTGLWYYNQKSADALVDGVSLNTQWIRENIVRHIGSGTITSGDVGSGLVLSGTILSGEVLSGTTVSGDVNLQARIEKGEIPDCDGTFGEPLVSYSVEELKKMQRTPEQIKAYGLGMTSAVYCWKKAGSADEDIVKKLQQYSLTDNEIQQVIMKAPK